MYRRREERGEAESAWSDRARARLEARTAGGKAGSGEKREAKGKAGGEGKEEGKDKAGGEGKGEGGDKPAKLLCAVGDTCEVCGARSTIHRCSMCHTARYCGEDCQASH